MIFGAEGGLRNKRQLGIKVILGYNIDRCSVSYT